MPWIDMDYNIKNSPLLMNFYEKIINYIQIISIHLINSIFGNRRECKTKKILFEAKRFLYNNLWPPTDLLFLLYTVLMAFVVYTDF